MRTPVTPTSDTGLRVRALADQAVAAALESDWTRASDLNAKILEAAPDDIEARNRMGRALLELGKLDEAKASFAEVLKAEPYNSIAIRGLQRIGPLIEPSRSGHRYVAAIVSNDQQNARVAIREVLQSGENSSRISFPGHHRPAETKERAYIKGNFFRFGRDADEEGDEDTDETEEETTEGSGGETGDESETVEEPLVVDTGDEDAEEEEEE